MAYRLADWERWQQMDFVVGIRIQLSNNHTCLGKDGEPHPFHDICDELEGEYPKTFKWVGWHPQCRCNAVPILKTVDEKIADNMAKRNGGKASTDSVNSVKRMPKAFTDWIKDNKNRIAAAKSQPYFIRDNATEVSKIIPGVLPESMMPATPVLSIAERAQMRHDARTPEQIADIRRRWIFHEAKLRHEARTPEQAEAIRSEYYGRKAIRHYGENILRYMDGIKDVDTSKLRSLLSGGDVESIMAEARKLRDAGKQILGQKAVEVNKRKKRITNAVSKMMPMELKAKSSYLNGEDYTFDKDFFDLLDPSKPIKLEIEDNRCSYSSLFGNLVHIGTERNRESQWHCKSVIYHEYGHCIDVQRSLWSDKTLADMRKKHIKWLNSKCQKSLYVGVRDDEFKLIYQKKEFSTNVAYIDTKLQQIAYKISSMQEETFTKLGIKKMDVIEQISATRDTIKSLVIDYGSGHPDEYFQRPMMNEKEYLAHAFENTFLGNRVFQKYMPEIYKEMIAYIRKLKPAK